MVAAWAAAARKATTYLKPLCKRKPITTRQQGPLPAPVQELLSTLLHLWTAMFQVFFGLQGRGGQALLASRTHWQPGFSSHQGA